MNEVLLAVSVVANVIAFFFYMEMKAARRELASYVIGDEDEINDSDDDNAELFRRFPAMLGIITTNTESIMIDTSKILAAVAAEKTRVDSLIALANGQTVTMKDLSAQLAAAIANNDPAALAQVQTDLDNAAMALSTETTAVTAAIGANTVPAPVQPAQPADVSGAGDAPTDPAAPSA